jgi:hypothetical protein
MYLPKLEVIHAPAEERGAAICQGKAFENANWARDFQGSEQRGTAHQTENKWADTKDRAAANCPIET